MEQRFSGMICLQVIVEIWTPVFYSHVLVGSDLRFKRWDGLVGKRQVYKATLIWLISFLIRGGSYLTLNISVYRFTDELQEVPLELSGALWT